MTDKPAPPRIPSAHEAFEAVLALQPQWQPTRTPAVQERGALVLGDGLIAVEVLALAARSGIPDLKVGASDGRGSPARVPWIRVHSRRYSPAPTVGWYVVVLFAADGSAVYLSLNQGTTERAEGRMLRRPRNEIAERTARAAELLQPEIEREPRLVREIRLADPGGLGDGYERGNVAAFGYAAGEVPDDDALARDMAALLSMLETLYAAETPTTASASPVAQSTARPAVTDVPAFVAWARAKCGPDLVPTRRAAEQRARELLDQYAGRMSREQARELGALFSQGSYGGVSRRNRFSPAFVGGSLDTLLSDIDAFNDWTARVWRGDESAAASAVDTLLRDPSALRGAGRSYPTMLMYLRDPARYAVWLTLTHQGLAALTSFREPRGRGGGWARYVRYCAAAHEFAAEYGLAPQEVDAILSEAGRQPPAPEATAAVVDVVRSDPDADPHPVMPTVESVAHRTHLPVETIEEWVGLLRGVAAKRQALFYGPPGTGKTFVATQLALYLAGSADRVAIAQFHPSFAYEDFIEGLRPVPEATGLTYDFRDGVFVDFCDDARGSAETYVFIVDELNRADVASVLGELMLLLEYRDRSIRLPYSKRLFSVPSNVVVLATMNTADRSLALVDFALRRRFHAIAMTPDRAVLAEYLARRADDGPALAMFDLVQERVRDLDVAPGQSYWMTDDVSAAGLERLWRYELKPYLAEFWFEQPGELVRLDSDVAELLAEEA